MNQNICKICNEQYIPTRKDNIYCSKKCKFTAKKSQRRLKHQKNCRSCQQSFETFYKNKIFCSRKCFGQKFSFDHSIVFNCEYCEKQNIIKTSRCGQKFCNKQCRLLQNPISQSQEVREKISKSRDKYIGVNHPMFGKHHDKETKEKISNHHLQTKCLSGNKNGMFGKKHTKETKEKMSKIISDKILIGCRKPHAQSIKIWFEKFGKEINARSRWEKKFVECIDKDESILFAEYESIQITYEYDQFRNYFPDLLIIYKDGTKKIVEIKPSCYLEAKINCAKFKAAEEYCNINNMIFEIWTEKSNPYNILNLSSQ